MKLVVQNHASNKLAMIAATLKEPVVLMQSVGKAVAVLLDEHFEARQAEGNEHGWPSRGFWHGEADSVASATSLGEVTAKKAEVAIASRPFLLKLLGGTVTPKRAGALAIPMRAEAYALGGKGSIRESAPGLQLIKSKSGAYLIKSLQDRTEFWFKLVPRAIHKPDPRALPPTDEIIETIEDAAVEAGRLMTSTGGSAI